MDDEKRIVGGYEVINSVHIGDREIVLGENMNDKDGLHYMVSNVYRTEFYESYRDAYISEDFVKIAAIFADRVKEQVESVREELAKENAPLQVITDDMCNKDVFSENMEGKILVVKPEVLRPEYRTASHQIIRCTGGNGASPTARGRAVFCDVCFSGRRTRFDRTDILGELKIDKYPEWLNDKFKMLEVRDKSEKQKGAVR